MFCSKCGFRNEMGYNFCKNCGDRLSYSSFNQATITNENSSSRKDKGTTSFVFGLLSIFSSLFVFVSLPCGIVGLCLGLANKVKDKLSKIGIVLSLIGIIISLFYCFAFYSFIRFAINYVKDVTEEHTLYGDGFTLRFTDDWRLYYDTGKVGLKYVNEDSYLLPIGRSKLSKMTDDFSDKDNQDMIYKKFYDFWNEEGNEDNIKIFSGSDGFNKLVGNIYYATYDYGISESNLFGKYYLLISEEDNVILSFMSDSYYNTLENNKRSLQILKTIIITDDGEVEDSSTFVNSSISLSDWKMNLNYSFV